MMRENQPQREMTREELVMEIAKHKEILKQVNQIGDFILKEFNHEPGSTGLSEGAIEVAIRLLTEYKKKDAILKEMFTTMRNLVDIQAEEGNYNYNAYMLGYYNGLELQLSIMESREPAFKVSNNKTVDEEVDSILLSMSNEERTVLKEKLTNTETC